jgi:hypothetical protein
MERCRDSGRRHVNDQLGIIKSFFLDIFTILQCCRDFALEIQYVKKSMVRCMSLTLFGSRKHRRNPFPQNKAQPVVLLMLGSD